jgi:D12 class N6 adenine-specific DNA methyltransferase
MVNTDITPLIKWAGGKRRLLADIRQVSPNNFDRYFEPFFGSGALFFSILPENAQLPISLVTGLMIRPIQSGIERRKKGWMIRQVQQRRDDYASILLYMLYPEQLTHDLIFAALRSLQAIGMIIFGLFLPSSFMVAILPETISTPGHNPVGLERVLLWVFAVTGSAINSWGISLLMQTTQRMKLIRTRIDTFDSFAKTVPSEARKLKLEELARETRLHGRLMLPPDELKILLTSEEYDAVLAQSKAAHIPSDPSVPLT